MDLYVCSYGATLCRDNGRFAVDMSDGRHCVPVDAVDSIFIGRGVTVTADALFLAVESGVPVVMVERSGKPLGRVWSVRYGSISTIRKGQAIFAASPEGVKWVCQTLARKVEGQRAMLFMLPVPSAQRGGADPEIEQARQSAMTKLDTLCEKISKLEARRVADVAGKLRGWEGTASRLYFETVSRFLPPQYRFEQRSQHPAMDVANAMLNYAYGILYSMVEGAIIAAGADPYVGMLHRDDYGKPVLVYDAIEPFRVWADYVVFALLGQNVITDECYSVGSVGDCWLEPLGRRMLVQSMNDYMTDVIDYYGVRRSRAEHIRLFAQDLAQRFKSFAVVDPTDEAEMTETTISTKAAKPGRKPKQESKQDPMSAAAEDAAAYDAKQASEDIATPETDEEPSSENPSDSHPDGPDYPDLRKNNDYPF